MEPDQSGDVELPPIGDGASPLLAALRSYVSGEADPVYGKTWEQWKVTFRIETITDLAQQAAGYASRDEWFRDLPTHVEARKLLREGFGGLSEERSSA